MAEAALAAAMARALGTDIRSLRPVRGGDINDAYRAELGGGGAAVFVKTHASPPAGFFSGEADGLARLDATGAVRVPEVLAVDDGDGGGPAFLALGWIEPGRPGPAHDEELGRALAALHTSPLAETTFGLERDNAVGAVPQSNEPTDTWAELLGERRLRPFAAAAIERGNLPAHAVALVDRVVGRLPELVGPAEPPSLLHGDLWGGNAMSDDVGRPVLIDPAVYRGHREVDLAMMRLFGGFSPRVFAAYAEAAPLADGHDERVPLNQLLPLLVHAILFGGGYGGQVVDVLRRYA